MQAWKIAKEEEAAKLASLKRVKTPLMQELENAKA